MTKEKDSDLIPMKTAIAIIVSVLVVVLLIGGLAFYFMFGNVNQVEKLGQTIGGKFSKEKDLNISINDFKDKYNNFITELYEDDIIFSRYKISHLELLSADRTNDTRYDYFQFRYLDEKIDKEADFIALVKKKTDTIVGITGLHSIKDDNLDAEFNFMFIVCHLVGAINPDMPHDEYVKVTDELLRKIDGDIGDDYLYINDIEYKIAVFDELGMLFINSKGVK